MGEKMALREYAKQDVRFRRADPVSTTQQKIFVLLQLHAGRIEAQYR